MKWGLSSTECGLCDQRRKVRGHWSAEGKQNYLKVDLSEIRGRYRARVLGVVDKVGGVHDRGLGFHRPGGVQGGRGLYHTFLRARTQGRAGDGGAATPGTCLIWNLSNSQSSHRALKQTSWDPVINLGRPPKRVFIKSHGDTGSISLTAACVG